MADPRRGQDFGNRPASHDLSSRARRLPGGREQAEHGHVGPRLAPERSAACGRREGPG